MPQMLKLKRIDPESESVGNGKEYMCAFPLSWPVQEALDHLFNFNLCQYFYPFTMTPSHIDKGWLAQWEYIAIPSQPKCLFILSPIQFSAFVTISSFCNASKPS
jgi:hypothetical protein